MQIVDCDVALGGDVRMVVDKRNVSIPELVVLQAVHGRDAVTNVRVTGEARNFNPVSERERLKTLYELNENSPKIDNLFPGVKPQMPYKLSEVLLVDPTEDDQNVRSAPLEVVRFDADQKPVRTVRTVTEAELAEMSEDLDDVNPPELTEPEGVDEAPPAAEGEAPAATGEHLLD